MPQQASLHAVVHGLVHGVNFRYSVMRHATELGLTGYVRNNVRDRTVEVLAEGDRDRLQQLLEYLKVGPRAARVERVDVDWLSYTGAFPSFDIRF